MKINFSSYYHALSKFLVLNFLSLLVLTSCNNRKNEKIQIMDCQSQYDIKDSITTKWNKTNAQIDVANCLYEKYFLNKNEKYKNELLKLAKIINANVEIYHDTIRESNFEYIDENNKWKPKYPYKFYIQAFE